MDALIRFGILLLEAMFFFGLAGSALVVLITVIMDLRLFLFSSGELAEKLKRQS